MCSAPILYPKHLIYNILAYNSNFSLFIWLLHDKTVSLHQEKSINRMSSSECLSRFTPNLFWDADPSMLSMDSSPAYIIQRVLEHGQMNDWRLINQYYGLDRIVEECKLLRTLDPVCLSFITTISHTKEEDYRCYHFRQSCPTPWNS